MEEDIIKKEIKTTEKGSHVRKDNEFCLNIMVER